MTACKAPWSIEPSVRTEWVDTEVSFSDPLPTVRELLGGPAALYPGCRQLRKKNRAGAFAYAVRSHPTVQSPIREAGKRKNHDQFARMNPLASQVALFCFLQDHHASMETDSADKVHQNDVPGSLVLVCFLDKGLRAEKRICQSSAGVWNGQPSAI